MLLEIFSDLVCPWCYIGRHRLERALAGRPHVVVERRWQPFELNPDLPAVGMDRMAYLSAKFGGVERARQIHSVIEETAARDGLPIALDRIRRTPNTFDAHRLVRLAEHKGLADQLTARLFRAYFVEGADIGDHEVLAAAAAEVGLERDEATRHLAEGAEADTVRGAQAVARQLGIQAVPCFVFDRRYALSGAQEPVAFLPFLDLADVKG